MNSDVSLLVSTTPDAPTARKIAAALVEEHLAACVSFLPNLESCYVWDGTKETTNECLLLIKSRSELYSAIEARLQQLHPYSCPELLCFTTATGFPPYFQWVLDQTPPR
jgi:periplasmic divalent cation tolerance protein